jgi:DedD protein
MAQPANNEELQLRKRARRRLIGAIVLVMIVVLVLPMVLDTEPKPVSEDIDIRIPSPDAGAGKSKIVPIAPAPDAKPAPKPAEKDATHLQATAPEAPSIKESPGGGEAPVAKSEAATGAKELEKAEAGAGSATKPSAQFEPRGGDAGERTDKAKGAHVVQVTALLNAEKARAIHERIAAAGIKSYTEVVTTARGEVTRVRAGPFATQAEAEKTLARVRRVQFEGKPLDGKVIPVK